MNIISKKQRSAIEMVQQITLEVVNNPNLRRAFCDEVRIKILEKKGQDIRTYKEVILSVLNWDISWKHLSDYTLRNVTWSILKTLGEDGDLTMDERKEIGKKAKQWWWKRGVIVTQIIQNMKPLTVEDRAILDAIFKSNDFEYKRWTTRNIKKIMRKLEEESGIHRTCEATIKHYLQNLSTAPKKEFRLWDDIQEVETLKNLFKEYYVPSKKLPTKIIMQRLNEKHGYNRTLNTIEWFIRTHIKTDDQKMKNEGLRTDEEMVPLKRLIDKKEDYRKKKWKWSGGINRELIYKEYKLICPKSTRTQRALEHKLKSLREKWSK